MPDIEVGSDWRGVILQLTVKRENKMLGQQSGELPINAVSAQTVEGLVFHPGASIFKSGGSKWQVLTSMIPNNCHNGPAD